MNILALARLQKLSIRIWSNIRFALCLQQAPHTVNTHMRWNSVCTSFLSHKLRMSVFPHTYRQNDHLIAQNKWYIWKSCWPFKLLYSEKFWKLSWVIPDLLLPKSSHISWQWQQNPKIQPFSDTGVVLWSWPCVLWLPFWESYIWNLTFIYKSSLRRGKLDF